MSTLVPDPAVLADAAIAGLCAAHLRLVQRVHGGVVRAGTSPAGEVAVVLGGGSGHYPAFAGWVGPGLAHGAACGQFFASPSASQVYAVCRAADNGGGILLSFGNYAGDVLHFGQAAERLRAEGVDVRVVPVTDDIASGGSDEPLQRRGIAGDLLVAKAAGAAAAEGASLDEVEALSRRANDRTRSLGVAFSGCTLPGADAPLFELPEGQMAVGLGIHGEPGIEHRARGTTAEVADLLVEGVLAEEPPRGENGYDGRVAVLVNGLGATGHEELLAVHARVAERLRDAGFEVVGAVVGEQVTSLDMAGVSLSMMFLDEDLERCWLAPCDSPAFSRSAPSGEPFVPRRVDELGQEQPVEPGAPASQALARTVREGLAAVSGMLREHAGALGDMDAVAGDGDHGQGMAMGSTAALTGADKALEQGAGARTLLVRAGDAWAEGAGGTSGALWGGALTAAASVLGDDRAADEPSVVAAVRAGADAILRLGGATPGDKTMVDAIVPFVDTLEKQVAAGEPLTPAWTTAAATARSSAEATADIVARRGRSRTHGDRSLGTPDPGAFSFALVVETVAGLLVDGSGVQHVVTALTWVGTSWKMTKTLAEAEHYATELRRLGGGRWPDLQPFVVPPSTALATVAGALRGSGVLVGAQNAHWVDAGAWTGEVSVPQVLDAGASFVELGHSERREHFAETDDTVNRKTQAVLRHGLRPLVCVGEPDEVFRAGGAVEHVTRQVAAALAGVADSSRVLLAYEPVWAIGERGRPARPKDVAAVFDALQQRYGGAVAAVLYGGSVRHDNAEELLRVPGVDGLFVGRAAWQVEDFIALLDLVQAHVADRTAGH